MKKLLILLAAAVLVTGFAFAQEYDGDNQSPAETNVGSTNTGETSSGESTRKIEWFNAEINIGFPIHWTNGLHDNDEDKTVTANTSIGVGITFNFTEVFGLILDADFFYSAELTGISTTDSDHISLSGANVFLGPLFYLYNNNVFRIPLAVGIHMYYFSSDLWVAENTGISGQGDWISRSDLQLGVGLSIGFQFHFDSGIYIFNRTNVNLDFVRIHSITGNISGSGGTLTLPYEHADLFDFISWNVKPAFGIGIRF